MESISGSVVPLAMFSLGDLTSLIELAWQVQTLARIVLEENFTSSNGHLLELGGQKACQNGLGPIFFRRIFTDGIPLNIHLYWSFRNHTTLQNVKIWPQKKVSQNARLIMCGGVQVLFGQCPNECGFWFVVASLMVAFKIILWNCEPRLFGSIAPNSSATEINLELF